MSTLKVQVLTSKQYKTNRNALIAIKKSRNQGLCLDYEIFSSCFFTAPVIRVGGTLGFLQPDGVHPHAHNLAQRGK